MKRADNLETPSFRIGFPQLGGDKIQFGHYKQYHKMKGQRMLGKSKVAEYPVIAFTQLGSVSRMMNERWQ